MAEMPPSALIASTTASSNSGRQSHRTLAFGVRRNKARWPMAKCGSMPTPISPGSLNFSEFRLVKVEEHRAYYAAELRPWSWLLGLTVDCRIFQNLSVVQILDEQSTGLLAERLEKQRAKR